MKTLSKQEAELLEKEALNGCEVIRKKALFKLLRFEGFNILGFKDSDTWAQTRYGSLSSEIKKHIQACRIEAGILGAQHVGEIPSAVALELTRLMHDTQAKNVLTHIKQNNLEISLVNVKKIFRELYPKVYNNGTGVSNYLKERARREPSADCVIREIDTLTTKQKLLIAQHLYRNLNTKAIKEENAKCIDIVDEVLGAVECLRSNVNILESLVSAKNEELREYYKQAKIRTHYLQEMNKNDN